MKECVLSSYRYLSTAAALIICTGLFTSQLHAGVYDDVKAWWHFDYDADSDDMADLGEIRDQLDWGTAAAAGSSGFHADYIYGIDGGPGWTNEVVSPAGGNTYGGKSMYFQAPTNATGAAWSDSFRIADTALSLNNSATIVTRFRWEGYANASEQKVAWIYNNGLGWADYTGWMFGIRDGSAFSGSLGMYVGRTPYTLSSISVTTGVWYEAAAVLTDNGTSDTIEFYLWKEGGTLKYQKLNSSAVTNASPSITTTIGAESSNNGYSTGNSIKCFKGAINHIAVWDRALSYEEIVEAFGHPQPLLQVGINNTTQNELRDENEVDETYYPGDPWHTMPRAVKTGKDAILKIPMTSTETSLDYALYLNTYGTDAESSTADISLIVNNNTNKTYTLGRHDEAYWLIPKEDLISGTNTFTLHYNGGTSAYLTFDWLQLCGSWQVGYDNNSAGEFVIEGSVPDDYYVTDPDWMHLERALTSYGQPTINIHFALSSEMLRKYRHLYTYTTRVVSQSGAGTHAFSIAINGTNIYSTAGLPNSTLVSVDVPTEYMNPGMNEINLIYDDTSASSYMQFDFHRLEVRPFYGTVILIH